MIAASSPPAPKGLAALVARYRTHNDRLAVVLGLGPRERGAALLATAREHLRRVDRRQPEIAALHAAVEAMLDAIEAGAMTS